MTVSEKHINAAMSLNSLAQECLILDKSSEEAVSAIAAALASAEREGMMRAATFAAIHSQYPIENDYDRGYAQGAKDAAARIRREANTHSPDTPFSQVNSPASFSSPEPGTISPETANEVPAQDGGGNEIGESLLGKSNAARPASVDAQPNGRGSAGQAGESVVTAGETAPNSHSPDIPPRQADSAGSVQPSADPATLHASRNGEG